MRRFEYDPPDSEWRHYVPVGFQGLRDTLIVAGGSESDEPIVTITSVDDIQWETIWMLKGAVVVRSCIPMEKLQEEWRERCKAWANPVRKKSA